MIGNDIVDLKLAQVQSNWSRRGFQDKVFTPHEKSLILGSSEADILVWRLWSMKESAYKANYRLDKVRKFNPKKLECKLIDNEFGEVKIGTNLYKLRTETNQLYIHSIALKDRYKESIQQNIHNNESKVNSSELYDLLLQHVAISGNYDKEELLLRKTSEFIPELYSSKNKLKTLCSLSHHGKYGAYIFTN